MTRSLVEHTNLARIGPGPESSKCVDGPRRGVIFKLPTTGQYSPATDMATTAEGTSHAGGARWPCRTLHHAGAQ